MQAGSRKLGSDATPLIRDSLPSDKGAATGLTFRSTILYLVLTRAVRSNSSPRLKSAMTSYILSEHTGIVRSSLRSSLTTSFSIPKVSSKETASTAPLISSPGPRAPHARSRFSAFVFSRPTMPTIVHAPLSEKQNFLPMVHGFFGSIVQVWGFPGVSGLSRPHALAALSKNPLGFRNRESRGYARGSAEPSKTGPNGARPGS